MSVLGLVLGTGSAVLGTSTASAAGGSYASTIPAPIATNHAGNVGPGGYLFDQMPMSNYPSTTSLGGLAGPVTDVDVTINGLVHSYPADLDVLLVGPHGQKALLMSDAGGSDDISLVSYTFDDQASAGLSGSFNPSGTYKPTNVGSGDSLPAPAPDATSAGSSLGVFNGTDGNGTWSLFAVDDNANDGGSMLNWSVSVTTATSPYPSTITVAGLPNGVTDVNVTLTGLTHPNSSAVDMLLVGPAGQQAAILSDAGGPGGVATATLVLDDAAAAGGVPTPIESGTYQPTNPGGTPDAFPAPAPTATGSSVLSAFNGTDPNGTWSLYAVDDGSSQLGVLPSWSLQITTVDPPATPAISTPANGSRDRDGVFTVTGNGPPSTTVKVLEAGVVKGTTTASAIGQWSLPLTGFANGPHTLTATATDSLGNVSAASVGVVVIVDSIAPGVSRTVPKQGAKKASRTANIRAVTNETVRKLTVTKANAFLTVAGSKTHLKAKVTYNAATRTIVINPKATLASGTTYKATITTNILDLAGNPFDQNASRSGLQKKTWKFTTR